MAEAHILRTDSLPMVDRGNGIQTIPLVTKEIGSAHMTIGLARFPSEPRCRGILITVMSR